MNLPYSLPGDGPVQRYEAREALGFLPNGYIAGFTLANDTTDATNDISIDDGVCRSTVHIVEGEASRLARDQIDLELPVSIIKQLDGAFAPDNYDPDGYSGGGGRCGMRSSSTLADGTWHIYAIGGRDVPTDIMAHDVTTQAGVVAELQKIGGYTAYRRVGSILRASSAIVPFVQHGESFTRKVLIRSSSATNPGTDATLVSCHVPVGVKVLADVVIACQVGAAGVTFYVLATSPDETDTVPTANLFDLNANSIGAAAQDFTISRNILTDTNGQIRVRLSASNAGSNRQVFTRGWCDTRDRDA